MDAQTVFKRHFGYTPAHVVRAPGALELLGSQAEHNEGLAVAVAVNRYIEIASAPRADGKIELLSSAYPGRELFWMSELKMNPSAQWTDYIKGVLDQLRKRGVNFSGFNAAVHGDIPMRAGMGSSAALSVGTALTIRSLYPFSLTETGATLPPRRNPNGRLPPLLAPEKLHFARLCHAAEASFVGGQSGLPDPISSLFRHAWHVTTSAFRFFPSRQAPR